MPALQVWVHDYAPSSLSMVCYFSPRPWYNLNIRETELTKQGRRDYTSAVVGKSKALLKEEAYSTIGTQNSPKGLGQLPQTKTAQEAAKPIAQKRINDQKVSSKTSLEDIFEPRTASGLGTSTPDRNSSPVSWIDPSSSGKRPPANSGSWLSSEVPTWSWNIFPFCHFWARIGAAGTFSPEILRYFPTSYESHHSLHISF